MSKHNDLALQDIECIKRGSNKLASSFESFGNRIAESNENSDANRRSRKNKGDDYIYENDSPYLTINFPKTVTININCKISQSSSNSLRNRELDEEEQEYKRAMKNCARSGGFYM